MLTLERKINAVMRYCLADDPASRAKAQEEIRALMTKKNADRRTDPEYIFRSILLDIGVPDRVTGHSYLLAATAMCLQDNTASQRITSYLYPVLAKKFGVTSSRVERAIRLAIESAWLRADPDVLQRYFGNTVAPDKGRPTNGEFIARICAEARQQMKFYEEYE